MQLTLNGLMDKTAFAQAGIDLPPYDITALRAKTAQAPVWVHFGIGNIFRIFLGGIADALIRAGEADRGIICVETFDFDVVDKIYRPYDNLALAVTLHGDGSTDKRVVGSLAEAIAARPGDAAAAARLRQVFTAPSLQMISFTITEKGYALRGADGQYFPFVQADIDNGPDKCAHAMSLVCSLLLQRFQAGRLPLALVSMDNVSQNGKKLEQSVIEIAQAWAAKGFVPAEFVAYLQDPKCITFPWTMIDKITPRPSDGVGAALTAAGVQDMATVITSKKTYIAPFVNAEAPGYLVIEDSFPNGRPRFEKAGVFMADRATVNRSERMKVTAALNPLHKPLGFYGCLLNYSTVADAMGDADIQALVRELGLREGMKVVEDPGIINPQAFIEEVITERFPNPYIPDTPERLVVDSSQMMLAMFGETVRAYVARFGSAKELTALPLTLAGWFRYLLAVDDKGAPLTLQPDPMVPELTAQLKTVRLGAPDSLTDQLTPIMANANIFGISLIEAGLADKIPAMVRSMIAGPGAVRATLHQYAQQFGK